MPVMTATAHLADDSASPGGSSHGHYSHVHSRAHSRGGPSGRNSSEGIFPSLQQWGLPPALRGPSPTRGYTSRGLHQQQNWLQSNHGHHGQHAHDAQGPSTLKLPQIPAGKRSADRTRNPQHGHTPNLPTTENRRHHGGDAVEQAAALLAHARRGRSAGKHAAAMTLLPTLQTEGSGSSGKLYGLTLARNLTVQQSQPQHEHLQPRRSPSPPPLHAPHHPSQQHHQLFPGPFEARAQPALRGGELQTSPAHLFSRRKSSPRVPPREAAEHHRNHDENALPPLMPPEKSRASGSARSRRRIPQKSAGALKLPDLTRRRGAGA
ncbi:hypothetical protein HDU90_000780 [Geranomyces variabilis]|nr:hypothetical protein HDU90_000780 [Geranomyces variabilis]